MLEGLYSTCSRRSPFFLLLFLHLGPSPLLPVLSSTKKMVSFNAKPTLALTSSLDDAVNSVAAHPSVTLSMNHDSSDVEMRVEASAKVNKSGKDLAVGDKRAVLVLEKKDTFKVAYGLLDDALTLKLNANASVNDKAVAIEYTANPGQNQSGIEASANITDDLLARVHYDLSSHKALDVDRVTLGLEYQVNDDTKAETRVKLASKEAKTRVTYRLDESNSLRATAHLRLDGQQDVLDRLVVGIKNTSDVLGKGDLIAQAEVNGSGSVNVRINKEWELDL